MALLPCQGQYLPIDCLSYYYSMNTFVVWCFDAASFILICFLSAFVIVYQTSRFWSQKDYGQLIFLFIFLFFIFITHPCMGLRFVANIFLVCMLFYISAIPY